MPGEPPRPAGPSGRALAVGAAVAAAVVAGAAVAIRFGPVRSVDTRISSGAVGYGRSHPGWTAVAWWVTQLGGTLAALAILVPVLAWLGAARRWPAAGYAAVALLVPGPLVEAVKHLVGRHRPDPTEPLAHFGGLSFPSGHSAHIAADVAVLWLLLLPLLAGWNRRVAGAVGVVVVLAVGWSRVALGAHYPTDVLAGWALGAAWVAAAAAVFPRSAWRGRDSPGDGGSAGDRAS